MSPEEVALWCALPLAIGICLDCLELLAERAQLAEGGIYGYSVLVTGRPLTLMGPMAPVFAAIFRYPAVLGLVAAQLAAAAVLLAAATLRSPELIVPAGIAVLVVLVARMLLYLRNQFGLDGSDQMMLVVASGLAVALLVPDRDAATIALYYVAAQLLLSYAVAGIAKAISPSWRSGRAIPEILSTIGHGSPSVGVHLRGHPRLSRLACWSVILFECSVPLLIVLGTPGAIAIIAAGLGFHLSIALLMGLNNFIWSFTATYPALLLLAHGIDSLWH